MDTPRFQMEIGVVVVVEVVTPLLFLVFPEHDLALGQLVAFQEVVALGCPLESALLLGWEVLVLGQLFKSVCHFFYLLFYFLLK